MKNALQEFKSHTDGLKITMAYAYFLGQPSFALPLGYTESEYERFEQKLDKEYDDGFGHQELFGFIWYSDGSYSDRREYDGSEWWVRRIVPTMPEDAEYV